VKEIQEELFRHVKKFDVNARDAEGNTPLHYAAKLRNTYCIE